MGVLSFVRELGLYSYRILYEIKSDNLIEVLAVIHKRQHLEPEDIPRK
jgi:plasmid stabilization system protein ParE